MSDHAGYLRQLAVRCSVGQPIIPNDAEQRLREAADEIERISQLAIDCRGKITELDNAMAYQGETLHDEIASLERRIEALERHAANKDLHWQEVPKRGVLDMVREYTAGIGTDPAADHTETLGTTPTAGEAIPSEEYLRRVREYEKGKGCACVAYDRALSPEEIQRLADPNATIIPPGFCRVKSKEEIAEMIEKVTEERKQTTEPRKPRTWWVYRPFGNAATYASIEVPGEPTAVEVREILRDANGNEIESEETRLWREKWLEWRNRSLVQSEEVKVEQSKRMEAEAMVTQLDAEVKSLNRQLKQSRIDACDSKASLRGMLGRSQQEVERLKADLAAERATVADVIAERDRLQMEMENRVDPGLLDAASQREAKLTDERDAAKRQLAIATDLLSHIERGDLASWATAQGIECDNVTPMGWPNYYRSIIRACLKEIAGVTAADAAKGEL